MTSQGPSTAVSTVSAALLRRISWRLIPFLLLLYFIAYIDRANLGFAKLTLQDELGLSNVAFTAGNAMFFVAYAIVEVPSNLMLAKVGARRWLARIMFTWGVITILTMFVSAAWQFYLARFLLGAAEAGFFPGVLFYLTLWYPTAHRARVTGWILSAGMAALIIGNPILGLIESLGGVFGLEGWQHIFLWTGVPAVIAAVVTLRYLPDGPRTARWLRPEEVTEITDMLQLEDRAKVHSGNPLRMLADPRVVTIALVFLCYPLGFYGLSFWLPTIVSGFGELTSLQIGILSSIPIVGSIVGLFVVPKLAGRFGHGYAWITGTSLLGAVGLAGAALSSNHVLELAFLFVGAFGISGAQPVLWGVPTSFLAGANAAAGLAVINGVANLGGGFGPLGIGAVVDITGRPVSGLWVLVGAMIVGALGAQLIRRIVQSRPERAGVE